jgi:hypothetical protein
MGEVILQINPESNQSISAIPVRPNPVGAICIVLVITMRPFAKHTTPISKVDRHIAKYLSSYFKHSFIKHYLSETRIRKQITFMGSGFARTFSYRGDLFSIKDASHQQISSFPETFSINFHAINLMVLFDQ